MKKRYQVGNIIYIKVVTLQFVIIQNETQQT